MKLKKILTVYKKETLETIRDRRTLVVMIMVPLILYPLLFIVMSQIMSMTYNKNDEKQSTIALIPTIPSELEEIILKENSITVIESENPYEDLKNGKISAYIQLLHYDKKESLNVCFDASIGSSRTARDRLEKIVEKYKIKVKSTSEIFNNKYSLPVQLGMGSVNISPSSNETNLLIGSILPVLLIVTLMFGALYPAIDLTAGEKERGTLETILTVPIHRLELLFGKYLTITTFTLITGTLNLVSLLLTYSLGLIQLSVLNGSADLNISFSAILILFTLMIPLSLFISAVMLSVCLFAKSFKEAQNLATPFYLLLLFPAMFAMIPDIRLSGFLSLIPILNVCLLFKDIIVHSFSINDFFTVFLSNTIFALLSISLISKLFNAEEILFSEGKGWQFSFKRNQIIPQKVLQPLSVFITFSSIMFLLFYVGSTIQLQFKHWGILGTQWLIIFLPVILVVWYNKVDFTKALNLKGFNLLSLFGSIMLTLGSLGIISWIAQVQINFFPEAAKIEEMLENILNFQTLEISPLMGILIFAITPAICEEILFRGIILSSLKDKLSPTITIALVALIFGFFHIYIFKIIPTALLGVSLTFIVYRTGSIYLGIISHALNNGLALILISYPSLQKTFSWLIGTGPFTVVQFLGMTTLIVAGVTLICYSTRRVKNK